MPKKRPLKRSLAQAPAAPCYRPYHCGRNGAGPRLGSATQAHDNLRLADLSPFTIPPRRLSPFHEYRPCEATSVPDARLFDTVPSAHSSPATRRRTVVELPRDRLLPPWQNHPFAIIRSLQLVPQWRSTAFAARSPCPERAKLSNCAPAWCRSTHTSARNRSRKPSWP